MDIYITNHDGVVQAFQGLESALATFYPEDSTLRKAYYIELPVKDERAFIPVIPRNERLIKKLLTEADYISFGSFNHSITKTEVKL